MKAKKRLVIDKIHFKKILSLCIVSGIALGFVIINLL